jgi:hypothetical protein
MQKGSMHDWDHVASKAFRANFRGAEQILVPARESKDCQMKRGAKAHDGRASNESHVP